MSLNMIKTIIKNIINVVDKIGIYVEKCLFSLSCFIFGLRVLQRRKPSWATRGEIIVIVELSDSVEYITVYPDTLDLDYSIKYKIGLSSGSSPLNIWLESEKL